MRTHSFADTSAALRVAARGLNWLAVRVDNADRLFWHKVRLSRFAPDIHFAVSREIEEPYRVARCIVLHLEPFRPGIVIGWYGREHLDEHEALRRAVSMRGPTKEELDAYDENQIHGPGRPGGLRFGATGYRPVGEEPVRRAGDAVSVRTS